MGQNLVHLLKARGYCNLVVIDKHPVNTKILADLHPDITVIQADLSQPDGWSQALEGADALVMLQAQIGGLDRAEFDRNNVHSTQRVLEAAVRAKVPYICHISSSVVNSMAEDNYTATKEAQEEIVGTCPIPHVVLRPTLMFGWFDRKHIGWLGRFMQRVPVFPIPGNGRFLRQPLYVIDFCAIIIACLERRMTGTYNISGQERIDYIDLIRALRRATGARALLLHIPYRLFWLLLWLYAKADRDPPFTTGQLEALVIPEEFEVIDWPGIFGVPQTPLARAMHDTFNQEPYCRVALTF